MVLPACPMQVAQTLWNFKPSPGLVGPDPPPSQAHPSHFPQLEGQPTAS